MTAMNKLYLKTLIRDLFHHKFITGICLTLCTILCVFAGYHKVTDESELTEYNTRLQEYDEAIADVEQSLSTAVQQVEEIQEYVNESIYMQLDGQNIQVASVQYAITTEANAGNIFNALIYYMNEGGLRESLGDEYPDLQVKYWRDVVSCATGGNVFNVTVMHYDAEKAKQILDIVKQRLQEQIPVISEVQGDFTLREISTSSYVKADVNVTNTQINHLNTLKNYISNRADFTNKLISNQNGKTTFIENNMPILLESDPAGAAATLIFYLIIGLLLGLALPVAFFALRNVIQKRIRSEEDISAFAVHTIGSCHGEANYNGALDRGLVELKYFVENRNLPSVFFNILSDGSGVSKVVDDYAAMLNKENIPFQSGLHLQEEASELRNMIACGTCVLVVQIGKTTYPQIEKQLELCHTLNIDVLGCIVIA